MLRDPTAQHAWGVINAFWEIKGQNQNIETLWKGHGIFSFHESYCSTQKMPHFDKIQCFLPVLIIPSLLAWIAQGVPPSPTLPQGSSPGHSIVPAQPPAVFCAFSLFKKKNCFWWRDLAPDPLIVIRVPFLLWYLHDHCSGNKKMVTFGGSREGRGQCLTGSDQVF